MVQQLDSAKSDFDNTYRLLVNGRVRRGTVKPVNAPVEITASLPTTGNVQGLYSFDTYLLIFISGAAYYRKMIPEAATWTKISNFSMSASAPVIYLESVPQSTVNRVRSLSTDGSINLGSPVAPSEQCLIACDGVTQPYVIFADGTARITQGYKDWTSSNREYVPIMKCPMYVGGVLYGMMADTRGKFTQIVRSVSGRPLDFMIVINENGEKVSAIEKDNGALALATNVSFAELTALKKINGVDGGFLATTLLSSTLVTPDKANKIYGEPTFNLQFLFDVGAVSPFAIADIMGDTAVVYPGGIRTFNGVQQAKFQGRNEPLSAALYDLLGNTRQITAAAVEFDNYVGFGIDSVHGPGIVWYDTLLSAFVAFDSTLGVGLVRQFAAVVQPTTQRLFFLTANGKVYEAFAGNPQRVTLCLQAQPAAATDFVAVRKVIARFIRSQTAGYAQCSVYSDARLTESNAVEIPAGDVDYRQPLRALPDGIAIDARDSTVARFEPDGDFAGRNQVAVTWDADAELFDVSISTDIVANSQQNPEETEAVAIPDTRVIFVGNDGRISANRQQLNDLMQKEKADFIILLGGITPDGTRSHIATYAAPYWQNVVSHSTTKLYAIPGRSDLDVPNAEPLFNWLQLPPTRYYKIALGDFAELYMLNDGYDSDSNQTEVDNSPTFATGNQAFWFRAQLDASTARHKFVAFYNAPRSSSAAAYPGNTNTNALDISGVTALFTGSALNYERLVGTDDGVPRFNVGTGGITPLDGTNSATHSDSQKIVNDNLGYLVATIKPLSVEIIYKDINGTPRDRYRI